MTELVNLMEPSVAEDPFPVYAELRRRTGVCQVDPFEMWAISRYDDVVSVLKDPQRFSSGAWKETFKPDWLEYSPLAEAIFTMDPPDHSKLRNLITPAFTGPAILRLEAKIQGLARELAEKVVSRREVDFIPEFATPLVAGMIGDMLGLDPGLYTRFKEWTDDLGIIPLGMHTEEQIVRIRKTVEEMLHYFTEVIEERQRHPGDDMVTTLLQANVGGVSLTRREVMGFLFTLLGAGLETSITLLGNAMAILLERPEDFERVKKDRSLIPSFVEETLRYAPPARAVFRHAAVDTEIAGVTIPAGSMVNVLVASALRDEKYYPEGEKFLIDRNKPVTLPFGHGIHFCLGALLSRKEARAGFEELFSRIRGFSLQPGKQLQRTDSLVGRPIVSLPLVFDPV